MSPASSSPIPCCARRLARPVVLSAALLMGGCAGLLPGVPAPPPPSVEPPAPPPPAPDTSAVPPSAPEAERPAEPAPEPLPEFVPALRREFRAAWIATVDNIDWPSRPGLPVAAQQAELIALLDRAVDLKLNAVILQVRPTADAFYASRLEPWSYYLTGEQGRAPEPFYDPLAFAVEQAHRRGLELHAWFNPYRTGHPTTHGRTAPTHVSRTHPEIVRRYGDLGWLDPGEPLAADHTTAVILDVVRRYDIDGVHLDDYFYPYPVQVGGRALPFPDDASWSRARANGEARSRDDWRRDNVNRLIERLYREIKAEKPWVKFGISPFGIWRPGYPEGIRGLDAYAALYADARLWLRNGWLDYVSPQLYWSVESTAQSYPALLAWWAGENVRGRHLWPGNFASRVLAEDRSAWRPEEIVDQIGVTRADPRATGNVHFSMKALLDANADLGDHLADGPYAESALVPASPWLDAEAPGPPRATLEHPDTSGQAVGGRAVLTLTPPPGEPVWLWAVRVRRGERWELEVVPGEKRVHLLRRSPVPPDVVVVSAVDRASNEGPPVAARLAR